LLTQREKLRIMSDNARRLAHPDAAQRIAAMVMALAQSRQSR
jgi:UDP-N-acetylglucosamine:LPS N-acetylglucosamine transferase